MKYLRIFETETEYTNYYKNGVPSGVLVYVKDTKKAIFSSNNIDGETKSYELTEGGGASDNSELIEQLELQIQELQSTITDIEGQKATIEAQLETVKNDYQELNAELFAIREELAGKDNQIEELRANQESHEITFDESTKTLSVNDIQ